VLLVLVGLWIPAAINLSGVKNMGTVQVVTTIVKFVVLAFMATVGLFFIQAANYVPFNVSGGRAIAAIGGGMAIALQRPFRHRGADVGSRDLHRAGLRRRDLGSDACHSARSKVVQVREGMIGGKMSGDRLERILFERRAADVPEAAVVVGWSCRPRRVVPSAEIPSNVAA
jgi:hypothetical protein